MPIPVDQQTVLLKNQVELIQRCQEALKANSYSQDAAESCNSWAQAIINLAVGYSKIEYGETIMAISADQLQKVVAAIRNINESAGLQQKIEELETALDNADAKTAEVQAALDALKAEAADNAATVAAIEEALTAEDSELNPVTPVETTESLV